MGKPSLLNRKSQSRSQSLNLVIDRSAFDRIIQSGGFITGRAGSAVDANAIPIDKQTADHAMDAAACIGCGACVAVCPNASAMLFCFFRKVTT